MRGRRSNKNGLQAVRKPAGEYFGSIQSSNRPELKRIFQTEIEHRGYYLGFDLDTQTNQLVISCELNRFAPFKIEGIDPGNFIKNLTSKNFTPIEDVNLKLRFNENLTSQKLEGVKETSGPVEVIQLDGCIAFEFVIPKTDSNGNDLRNYYAHWIDSKHKTRFTIRNREVKKLITALKKEVRPSFVMDWDLFK